MPDVVVDARRDALATQVASLPKEGAGSRTLLEQPWCVELARELRADSLVSALLPANAVTVQCTLFDKSPTKNWLVALHQDLSIPVQRRDVQPPVDVLEQLVAVRIQIDDCPEESGALRVVPKSHSQGRLDRERAEELRLRHGETVVRATRGEALVMRPLILHASSKATSLRPRRVLHFVFGPPSLPLGMEWRWAV